MFHVIKTRLFPVLDMSSFSPLRLQWKVVQGEESIMFIDEFIHLKPYIGDGSSYNVLKFTFVQSRIYGLITVLDEHLDRHS